MNDKELNDLPQKVNIEEHGLIFSLPTWAQMKWMCAHCKTEIAVMAISSANNPFYVEDLYVPKQTCSEAHFEIDDDDISAFQEDMADINIEPFRFGRILIHTHPGSSARPSSVDEENFTRIFKSYSWAIMLILARNGDIYCRFTLNQKIGNNHIISSSQEIKVQFDLTNIHQNQDIDHILSVPTWKKLVQDKVTNEYENRQSHNWNQWHQLSKGRRFIPPIWNTKRQAYIDINGNEHKTYTKAERANQLVPDGIHLKPKSRKAKRKNRVILQDE